MFERFDLNMSDGHNFIITKVMEINQPNTPGIQIGSTNELPLSAKQISVYKEIFDKQANQKKKSYLMAIQEHNNQLIAKVKQLDKKLNIQVDLLGKKIVSKKKFSVPKFQDLETTELKSKFQQLQKLKKELDLKKSGIDSLQFLFSVKSKYSIDLNKLIKSISDKKKQIANLKKIKSRAISSDSMVKKQIIRIGDFDLFSQEIQQLKRKVKEKNQKIQKSKEQYLMQKKQIKSGSSIILDIKPKLQKQEENDPQLNQLKRQYQQLGKKIDILKSKKAALLIKNQKSKESDILLQRVKQKYDNLLKLTGK